MHSGRILFNMGHMYCWVYVNIANVSDIYIETGDCTLSFRFVQLGTTTKKKKKQKATLLR